MTTQILKRQVGIFLGKAERPVGELTYIKDGAREYSSFAYDSVWLASPECFEVSPDLPLIEGRVVRRAAAPRDSCFHFAITDTEPDAWGRRVIARAHAKERKKNPSLSALTAFDYLAAVDDVSRVGALRLRDGDGKFLRTANKDQRAIPPLLELQHMYDASRSVERGNETAEDLQYLLGKGTSLGGMRPKCTLLEEDSSLALGKFPSVNDSRNVTRGEVLALRLAERAGLNAARGRIVQIGDAAVAVIRRFDRTEANARIPYLSAASMLQAPRNEERAYTEVADIIRAKCARPREDARELWRRMVFNLFITNVDDHLQNLGFLYEGQGMWRLAPAFDVNPFPDKERESKTWLSEDMGPITSLSMLMERADYFGLQPAEALESLSAVYSAVSDWRKVALSTDVGLLQSDLNDFAPAFEHPAMQAAQELLA